MRPQWCLVPLAMVGLSCSPGVAVVETTTTTSTVARAPSTTELYRGADCKPNLYWDVQKRLEEASKVPTSRSKLGQLVTQLIEFRRYIRYLDIPLLAAQQSDFVRAIEDFTLAISQAIQTDGRVNLVTEAYIPYSDAYGDFIRMLGRICGR